MAYTLSTGSNKKIEVPNASTNNETSLEFVGKFKKDFEPIFQQNLIHLLTNCCSKEYTDINTVPLIVGQTVYVRGTPPRMFLCTNDDPKTIEELVLTSTDISKYIIANNLPTGKVTIDVSGNTYTANTSAVVDLDGLGPFKYQWAINGVDIAGANKNSYTGVIGDIGKTLTVTVSYTDLRKHLESLTSNDVIVDDPTLTYVPTITLPTYIFDKMAFIVKIDVGTAPLTSGDKVTITIQDNQTYFESSDITALLVNNQYTYTATGLDIGNYTVNVTRQHADNNQSHRGSTTKSFVSVAKQINATGTVTITWDKGSITYPSTDSTLTATATNVADPNGVNQSTATFIWYKGISQITNPSTDTSKYKVQANDIGHDIRAIYSFKDNLGNSEYIFSNAHTVITGQVSVSGTLSLKTVTQNGTKSLEVDYSKVIDPNALDLRYFTKSYVWYRDNVSFVNNSATYVLTASDISKSIKVSMSYTDELGKTETITSDAVTITSLT